MATISTDLIFAVLLPVQIEPLDLGRIISALGCRQGPNLGIRETGGYRFFGIAKI